MNWDPSALEFLAVVEPYGLQTEEAVGYKHRLCNFQTPFQNSVMSRTISGTSSARPVSKGTVIIVQIDKIRSCAQAGPRARQSLPLTRHVPPSAASDPAARL